MKYLLFVLIVLSPLAYSDPFDLQKIKTKFNSLKSSGVSLKDFKGKRVIVRFWASWCTPCKRDLPLLDKFYLDNHDRDVEVLGVSVDEDISKAKAYLQNNPVHFPVIFDLKKQLPQEFAAESLAALYYFDEKGKLLKALNALPDSKEFYSGLFGSASK